MGPMSRNSPKDTAWGIMACAPKLSIEVRVCSDRTTPKANPEAIMKRGESPADLENLLGYLAEFERTPEAFANCPEPK